MFRTASKMKKCVGEESLDHRSRGTSSKAQNGKAICCTLLKRITNSKV